MSDLYKKISDAVITGNISIIVDLTKQALLDGYTAYDVLNRGLVPGMDYVGVEFKSGAMYIPEVLLSARSMQASLNIIRPLLAESESKMVGKVVVGTVKGDLHDIGKNLVGMMLEGAGFEVVDLGTDVSPEAFVNAVKEQKPDIVALSALLTTTMRSMEHTIVALNKAGLRDGVKVIIGGAPVAQQFADQIGADGYGSSAPAAVELSKKLLENKT